MAVGVASALASGLAFGLASGLASGSVPGTAAGLAVLMDDDAGLTPLMVRTVAAATERGRELGRA